MTPLEGKVAVVIDADTQPAGAVAMELARRGATVAAQYHSSFQAARWLVREIERMGGFAVAFKADPTDPKQAESLCFRVHGALERIDVVVLNAAPAQTPKPCPAPGNALELAAELDTVRARVLGCLSPAYAALPVIAGQGSGAIICLSDANGGSGPSSLGEALVSSAVATALACLTDELRPTGIAVATVPADGHEVAQLVCGWLGRQAEAPQPSR